MLAMPFATSPSHMPTLPKVLFQKAVTKDSFAEPARGVTVPEMPSRFKLNSLIEPINIPFTDTWSMELPHMKAGLTSSARYPM